MDLLLLLLFLEPIEVSLLLSIIALIAATEFLLGNQNTRSE